MLPETMLSGSTIVEQRVLQQVDNLGLMGVGQPSDNTVYIFLYANLRYHQKHTVTKRVTPLIAPLLSCVHKSWMHSANNSHHLVSARSVQALS